MQKRIIIPKKGKNVGEIIIEGMEQNANCEQELSHVALQFGSIKSVEKKDHFGDDNPVHDKVILS